MTFLWMFLCLLGFRLEASPIFATFDQLPQETQEIQIRGFLYKISDKYVLAKEPELKSCCIGTASKTHEQIFILGEFPETSYALTLQGHLQVRPVYDLEGRLIELYHLDNAQIVPHETPLWKFGIITLSMILMLFATMLFLRRWLSEKQKSG